MFEIAKQLMRTLKQLTVLLAVLCSSNLVLAVEMVKGKSLCAFVEFKSDTEVFLFEPGAGVKDYFELLSSDSPFNPEVKLASADVKQPLALLSGEKKLLLYQEFEFQQSSKNAEEKWQQLFLIAHQLAHLHLGHNETTPEQEAEADEFAGRLMRGLGISRTELAKVVENGERRAFVLHGWENVQTAVSGWEDPDPQLVPRDGPTEGNNGEVSIPVFPWPPPRPSASTRINELFLQEPPLRRYQDVADLLEAALGKTGYAEYSYYAVPKGFALATRLEQIHADGRPKEGADRWSVSLKPTRVFSLGSYLQALFTSPEGYFRVVVFIVTPRPFSLQDVDTEFQQAQTWLHSGLNILPPQIGVQPLPENTVCTALIYEFRQTAPNSRAEQLSPSAISALQHLQKTELLSALERSPQ